MYEEPNEEKPCFKCEFMNYDTWNDEKFCKHIPLSDMINKRSIVETWGTCEFWKKSEIFNE